MVLILTDIQATAFTVFQKEFPMIMGMIPTWNTHAIDYLKKVGLQDGGTFPFLIWSAKDDKPVEGKILYITQEEL